MMRASSSSMRARAPVISPSADDRADVPCVVAASAAVLMPVLMMSPS